MLSKRSAENGGDDRDEGNSGLSALKELALPTEQIQPKPGGANALMDKDQEQIIGELTKLSKILYILGKDAPNLLYFIENKVRHEK